LTWEDTALRLHGGNSLDREVSMMGHRTKLKSGDEYDAFGKWRRIFHWQAGQLKAIKRRFSKRVRQEAKKLCT